MISRNDKKHGISIFKQLLIPAVISMSLLTQAHSNMTDQPNLIELSLEDLGDIEITTVSKSTQKLREAAASIYVITHEEIRRSGATSISEALRLAPNLQVARTASNAYAISSRGFNTTTTNKLLVLLDGRSVYTPLYSGVFWDVQDTLMEDIERIEVISGPGATLWGANAVNGVINIITRNAADTHGTLVTTTLGSEEKGIGVRQGGKTTSGIDYRFYAKRFDRGASLNAAGGVLQDSWKGAQGGFRIDNSSDKQQPWTLQGDLYSGSSEQRLSDDRRVEGANLLGRWNRKLDNGHVQVQTYIDHTKREYPGSWSESLDTIDIDAQHQFKIGQHEILWGGGYRYADDKVQNGLTFAFLPEHAHLKNANFFVQDQIDLIANTLKLTVGTKFEHNNYSGLDIQPDARLSWVVNDKHQLWGGISRAVRAPSRIDRDIYAPAPPSSPFLAGGSNFTSEVLTAYQLGYRGQFASRFTLSTTIFYNDYKKIRSIERDGGGVLFFANRIEGTGQGVELWGDLQLTQSLRVHMGYVYIEKHLTLPADNYNPAGVAAEGNDPKHQVSLQSSLNLPYNIEFDSIVRYISALPSPAVPSYTAFDFRLSWKPTPKWELAFVAQNLLDNQHAEFGAANNRSEIERSIFIKSTWKF